MEELNMNLETTKLRKRGHGKYVQELLSNEWKNRVTGGKQRKKGLGCADSG